MRYGLRLNMDEKYTGLKKQLSELCSLKPEQILLAEVHSSNIKVHTEQEVASAPQTLKKNLNSAEHAVWSVVFST